MARPSDIQVLLEDTASHLNRFLRSPFVGNIEVVPSPPSDPTPRVPYRPNPDGPFSVQFTARCRSWSQFSFQFAHEFCHILSDYELLRDNPNQWFHEAICEVASVFTLRRMAETWTSYPPFRKWSGYADSLAEYAELVFQAKNRNCLKGKLSKTGYQEESLSYSNTLICHGRNR